MATKISQTFNQLNNPQPIQKVEDANRVVGELTRHINTLVGQLNTMKREVEQGGNTPPAITIVNTTGGGGSSGGSAMAGKTIVQVSKAITGGVAYNEVFAAPSVLLTIPIGYKITDGLTSAEILPPTGLNVAGFTIQSLEDCQVLYSYQYV
jgi:hypothetical protein